MGPYCPLMRWPDKPSRPADSNSILAPGETETEWDKADGKTKTKTTTKNKNNKTRKRNKVQSNVATKQYAVGP